MIEGKPCTKCKEEKPFSAFYKSKNGLKNNATDAAGYHYMCRICSGKRSSKYVKAHPEKGRDRQRNNDIKFPEKKMWRNARKRARYENVPFDIEISDIVIPPFCPVLGIPIFRGSGSLCMNSPSLDKIIPKNGYTKGNVAVISYRANAIKLNATSTEIFRVAAWLEGEEQRIVSGSSGYLYDCVGEIYD